MRYNHFDYGEQLAQQLICIRDVRRKYFRAFGLEDLIEISEKISNISGAILIAVNGVESDVDNNGYDGINELPHYAFIVAYPTKSTDATSIIEASCQSEQIINQIIARMMKDLPVFSPTELVGNFKKNGVGPIGDNYYGTMLSFVMKYPFDTVLDQSYWEE